MANLETEELQLPIEWNFNDVKNKYATNLLVQPGENEFFISFFEITPPLLFSPEDEGKVTSVQAECVARIVVSKHKIQSFVDALQLSITRVNAAPEGS